MKQKRLICNMKESMNLEEYIEEALLKLMKEKEFKNITITDITNKAGVSRISFYRKFSSKEDVVKSYLTKALKDWGKRWEESGDTNIAYQIFKFFYEQKEVLPLLYQSNLQYLLEENILSACGYKEGMNEIEDYIKVMVAYIIYGWCTEWYKRGMKETPEEMSKKFEAVNNQQKK